MAIELTGLLRIEMSHHAGAMRMRYIFLARPVDEARTVPKSIPDYESVGAVWATMEVCAGMCVYIFREGFSQSYLGVLQSVRLSRSTNKLSGPIYDTLTSYLLHSYSMYFACVCVCVCVCFFLAHRMLSVWLSSSPNQQ